MHITIFFKNKFSEGSEKKVEKHKTEFKKDHWVWIYSFAEQLLCITYDKKIENYVKMEHKKKKNTNAVKHIVWYYVNEKKIKYNSKVHNYTIV